jgi:GT2 family glycosyltransferase
MTAVAPPSQTWVIVSYGGVADATRLVASLGPEPRLRIVLCANKPGDFHQANTAFGADARVTVLDFEDNPGYLPALERALPHVDASAPVILANADLVADDGAVERIVAAVATYDDAGALAPAVIGSLGRDQNPNLLAPPSARWLQVVAAIHRFPPVADLLLLRKEGHSSRNITGVEPGTRIWAGHGSCVVLTPEYFARGGSVAYPFALFGEELWFGNECARLGLTVRYVPDIVLRHEEHAATGARRRRGHVAQVKYEGLRWWAQEARRRGW